MQCDFILFSTDTLLMDCLWFGIVKYHILLKENTRWLLGEIYLRTCSTMLDNGGFWCSHGKNEQVHSYLLIAGPSRFRLLYICPSKPPSHSSDTSYSVVFDIISEENDGWSGSGPTVISRGWQTTVTSLKHSFIRCLCTRCVYLMEYGTVPVCM